MNTHDCLKSLAACLLLSVLTLPVLATPAAAQYQVLYDLSGPTESGPYENLLADKAGNLYGSTKAGGANGAGTIFKLAPDGTETVLYTFTGGNDGFNPDGPLTEDKDGNLYGTTFHGGGTGCEFNMGCGTVFKLAPDGSETVLHAFAGGAKDGAMPHGGVAIGKKGDLYGAAQLGGANEYGTVFVLHPSGKLRVLHSFTRTDGTQPEAGVILDKSGNIYGTTI
jgi:uncharacterized repeat protein (TIGR03803 family)